MQGDRQLLRSQATMYNVMIPYYSQSVCLLRFVFSCCRATSDLRYRCRPVRTLPLPRASRSDVGRVWQQLNPDLHLLRLLSTPPNFVQPSMETYTLPYMPTELSGIHVRLFKNVRNSAAIRASLIAAASMEGEAGVQERDRYDYCFVEAKTVSKMPARTRGCSRTPCRS